MCILSFPLFLKSVKCACKSRTHCASKYDRSIALHLQLSSRICYLFNLIKDRIYTRLYLLPLYSLFSDSLSWDRAWLEPVAISFPRIKSYEKLPSIRQQSLHCKTNTCNPLMFFGRKEPFRITIRIQCPGEVYSLDISCTLSSAR